MNQDLKKTLWAAADKLRSSMDAAEYKHIVLGLIFLKYISDAFDERRAELEAAFADESNDLYLPDAEDRALATEERDYYTMVNCFWVPGPARWETICANAKQADIGTRIDGALDAIEADNPRLKGILDKRFGRAQLEPGKLGELVDVVQQANFSELLQHSLQRYRNRAIETAQVIEELIEMAKKFQAAALKGEELGLNEDEVAFYDALASNELAVRELGDETLKAIAIELTQKLRATVTVDWSVRDTVRARLRVMVRTLLRRYKYPPDRQDDAVETVLRQAESLSSAWSMA